jgi:hypothetical protein
VFSEASSTYFRRELCRNRVMLRLRRPPHGRTLRRARLLRPTGHAAVYLNHICAASPIELRICKNAEAGVVISRYHKINRDDWIAIPLISYLYSVTDAVEAPASVDKARVIELRRNYWKNHLTSLVPPDKNGNAPPGERVQLVGSSYDRQFTAFRLKLLPNRTNGS